MKKAFIILAITAIFTSCSQPTSTIDTTLQTKVDSILQNKMSEINAISGQAIVMDMAGNIKAIVGNGKKQPSSLMRPISLHKALETGKVHLSDTVDTEEGIAIINGDIIKDHNWLRGGYGKITVEQGFGLASNIANYKVARKAVDNERAFVEALAKYGYVFRQIVDIMNER